MTSPSPTNYMPNLTIANVISIVTVIVNIFLVYLQHRWRRKERNRRTVENWYDEVISICRSTRRTALHIDPGLRVDEQTFRLESDEETPYFDELRSNLKELEQIRDDIPASIEKSNVEKSLNDLVTWFRNPEYMGEYFSTTDVREEVIHKVDNIMSDIRKQSEKR